MQSIESLTQHQAAGDTRGLKLQSSDFRVPFFDPEKAKRAEEAAKAYTADLALQAINQRIRTAKIPLRLSRNIDESLQTDEKHEWKKKYRRIEVEIGTGFLFGLLGGYGTGKSQMGATLVHQACQTQTAMFIHAPELFDTIKDVFRGDDGDTVRQQLQKFISPKLLVIDEVNQGLTEADIRYLHRVICQRYDDVTDTLLISNENKENFQRLVGDRITSRMIECGGIIDANWPSFRTKRTKVHP